MIIQSDNAEQLALFFEKLHAEGYPVQQAYLIFKRAKTILDNYDNTLMKILKGGRE